MGTKIRLTLKLNFAETGSEETSGRLRPCSCSGWAVGGGHCVTVGSVLLLFEAGQEILCPGSGSHLTSLRNIIRLEGSVIGPPCRETDVRY